MLNDFSKKYFETNLNHVNVSEKNQTIFESRLHNSYLFLCKFDLKKEARVNKMNMAIHVLIQEKENLVIL